MSVILSDLSYLRKDGFLSFQTSKYRLHYYETPSGLRFVMNTDLSVSNARETLQQIYSNVRYSPSEPKICWTESVCAFLSSFTGPPVCLSAVCGVHCEEPSVCLIKQLGQ